MAALVLAGGTARRLHGVSGSSPKSMLDAGGAPLLAYIAAALRHSGLSPVVLVTAHLSAKVEEHFARAEWIAARVRVVRGEGRGTGGDALIAAEALTAETVLLFMGDTILDCDFEALRDAHQRHHGTATLALTRRTGVPNEGAFAVGFDGRVLASAEGDDYHPPAANAVAWRGSSTGALIVERSELVRECAEALEANASESLSLERVVIPRLIARRVLYAFDNGERMFLDIGTPPNLARMRADCSLVERVYGTPFPPPAEE